MLEGMSFLVHPLCNPCITCIDIDICLHVCLHFASHLFEELKHGIEWMAFRESLSISALGEKKTADGDVFFFSFIPRKFSLTFYAYYLLGRQFS